MGWPKKVMKTMGLLVLGGSLILTGCESKKPITSDVFKSSMEEKGFTVADCTDQYKQHEVFEKVYVAIAADESYQIEFYDLDNVNDASDFYENNKQIFINGKKGSGYAENSVEINNNKKYTLAGNSKYDVISMIDDTVIYVDASDQHKSDISGLIKELGY